MVRVLETILVKRTQSSYVISALEKHFERLKRSTSEISLPFPFKDVEEIKPLISSAFLSLEELNLENFRLRLLATETGLEVTVEPFTPRLNRISGASLYPCICDRTSPHLKTTPDHISQKAQEVARAHGYDEALLISSDGIVREGAWTNFFWWDFEGVLRTPKTNMLPGIIRGLLLDQKELEIVPCDTSYDMMIQQLSEAFITNALHRIIPVSMIAQERFQISERVWTLQQKLDTLLSQQESAFILAI